MNRSTLLTSTALLSALALVACGGDDEPAEDLDTEDELVELLPEDLQDGGTLTVGINPDQAPLKFVDEDGDLDGLNVDQLEAASELLGLELEWEQASFDALLPGLQAGTYDILASITDIEERHEYATFINYLEAGQAYVAHPESELSMSEGTDLCGLSAATVRGGNGQTALEDLQVECADAGLDDLELSLYADTAATFLAVQTQSDDVALVDLPPAQYNVSENPDDYEILYSEPGDPYGIVFDREDEELVEAYREAFLHLADTGDYQEIAEEWGVLDGAMLDFPINQGL